jgi:GTP cyclohydrolase III
MATKGGEKTQVERIEVADSIDEKQHTVQVESESITSQDLQDHDLDSAAKFLFEHKDVDISHIDISKVRHKIDRNVVSVMALCFIMQFLDKAVYNVSSLLQFQVVQG